MDEQALAQTLLSELNLDDAELATLQAQVTTAINLVNHSASNVDPKSQTAIDAVKTLATQLYYDRSLENGLSRGAMMMLTHLQAEGEANG
jgi:hypothetical protein